VRDDTAVLRRARWHCQAGQYRKRAACAPMLTGISQRRMVGPVISDGLPLWRVKP